MNDCSDDLQIDIERGALLFFDPAICSVLINLAALSADTGCNIFRRFIIIEFLGFPLRFLLKKISLVSRACEAAASPTLSILNHSAG
jgi:hypothetical protein